jgi:hypothetical protein
MLRVAQRPCRCNPSAESSLEIKRYLLHLPKHEHGDVHADNRYAPYTIKDIAVTLQPCNVQFRTLSHEPRSDKDDETESGHHRYHSDANQR